MKQNDALALDALINLDPQGIQWEILSENRILVYGTKSPSGAGISNQYLYKAVCRRCDKGNGFTANIPERTTTIRARWCTCKPCTVDANGITLWRCKYCQKKLPFDKFESRSENSTVPRLPCKVCYERTRLRAEEAKELKRRRDEGEFERVVRQCTGVQPPEEINNPTTEEDTPGVVEAEAEVQVQVQAPTSVAEVPYSGNNVEETPPTTTTFEETPPTTTTALPQGLLPMYHITKVERAIEKSTNQVVALSVLLDNNSDWKPDDLIKQLEWLKLQQN